jgi:ABC-type dipeptide/oligopeptide/nickel transport system permease component
MLKFIVRRIIVSIPTFLILITIVFFGLRVLPGDPAISVLGPQASAEALENLREQMGLNVPLWQQYIHFMGDTLRGDFGKSLVSGKDVMGQLAEKFPSTMFLTFMSIFIGCLIGIPLGILSARKKNTKLDSGLRFISLFGISVPPFLLGILMIILFSLKIPIFPSMGAGTGVWGSIYHVLLPAITLGLILSAVFIRFTRSSMLDEINQEYIRTARAKGIPERIVVYKHLLRNALIPVITVIGLNMTSLISGAVITETIFSRPGLGTLAVEAIFSRDFPVLQGCLILFSIVVLTINLLVDISYSIINPKIRPN